MNRTELHRAILRALLGLRPASVSRVRLVSRLYNDEILGGDSTRRFFVFLPDLHVISAERSSKFRFGFDRIHDTRWIDRGALLDALAGALLGLEAGLPSDVAMKTVQVGDFVDLWRERRLNAPDGLVEDVQTMVSRILSGHPEVRARIARNAASGSLGADLLLGNHDPDSRASIDLARARRSHSYPVGSKRTLFTTHGDLFDPLELQMLDAVQRFLVRNFAQDVVGSVYAADRTGAHVAGTIVGSQGSAPLIVNAPEDDATWPDWVNVWVTRADVSTDDDLRDSHELLPLAVEKAALLRAGDAAALADFGVSSGLPDLRTMVVGHSHQARLCVHRDPADAANDLCLVDAGAWIEEMHFGPGKDDDRTPSCTIAVLAGGDARIYQLDPADALMADGATSPF